MLILIISIIINLFIIYSFYKKVIVKIHEPEKKYRAEINSLMIEFNKTAKNNFDLMEEKILEIKNLLQIIDVKMNKNKKINNEKIPVKEKEDPDNVIEFSGSNKSTVIKKLFSEGKSSKNISKIMGISKAEVDLYLKLQKK